MVSQYCRIVWFIDLNFILLFYIDVNWINEQKAFAQGDVTLSLFATSPCFYEKNAPLWFFGGYNDMGSKTCHGTEMDKLLKIAQMQILGKK